MMDEFSKHEALDRTQLLADVFQAHLVDHPYIQASPEFSELCDSIAEKFAELYQKLGR